RVVPAATERLPLPPSLPYLLLFLLLNCTGMSLTIRAARLVMVLQFILTLSLAYLVATANVIFRDTQHLLGVLLQLLFFLSPVFYDASTVPARYQSIYRLNPLVHLIDAYRAVLLSGTLQAGLPLLTLAVVAV